MNLDTNATDPFYDNNHGTATLGEIAAQQNGFGTTGTAYNANFYFAGVYYTNGYDVGRGITTAISQLKQGDILMVEQQTSGPNTTQDVINNGGEYGLVPVEWFQPYYERIVLTEALGITVIEAAGNGGQNLDDPIYSVGNGGGFTRFYHKTIQERSSWERERRIRVVRPRGRDWISPITVRGWICRDGAKT